MRAMASSARRALLERLIDHAALFPPASMSMEDALAEDRRVRAGEAAWLVNRFVCPAARLAELGDEPLRLSVIVDGTAPTADRRIEAVELARWPAGDFGALELYVEVPLAEDASAWIDRLSQLGLRGKIRCGGAAVPSVEALAGFIRLCRRRGVPFKATAGLHHPIRRESSHGFLNLFAATLFGDEERALAEDDADAFRLTDEAFSWRGRSASPDEVARLRREALVAIGSCSIQEPVDDLKELGIRLD
jgi:hypothetical protein